MTFPPRLGGLSALVGEWTGPGHGSYPSVAPFDYVEAVRFEQAGDRPFLVYTQRSWDPTDGRPLHGESGYLRPAGTDGAELVLAQPTGIVEVDEGVVAAGDGGALHLELRSRHVACTTTAKDVRAVVRVLHVDGDRLQTQLAMAAVGQGLTAHLVSELARTSGPAGG